MKGPPAIILLLQLFSMLPGCWAGGTARGPMLRRHKRDWFTNIATLTENKDYNKETPVATIRCIMDMDWRVYYSLQGHGASEEPVGKFEVDRNTGLVYVNGKLDREEKETYWLTGIANFENDDLFQNKIGLKFEVGDENDNPPIFAPVPPATVNESSQAGTLVGKIIATDADKENCPHSKISYTLVRQEPSDGNKYFYIDKDYGTIYVREDTLDRERQSLYTLTVTGSDMDGAPGGFTGTGTIDVKVLDINDNHPELEKDEFSDSIMENTAKVEVMRFKVLDADEEKSDNWLAVFDIISGNEDGIFSIETDPNTNEGVLILEKSVDFEENPNIILELVVSNPVPVIGVGDRGGDGDGEGDDDGGGKADVDLPAGAGPGTGTDGGVNAGAGGPTKKREKKKRRPRKGKVYPVNIAVLNEPEGMIFKPAVKPIPVSENPEDNPVMEVISAFPAIDEDTGKPAENVQYAKGYDPDNWLMIDPETGEIRLRKTPDRESPFVVNGIYLAKILGTSQDEPQKTITGTIALMVGDMNDNCPTLKNNVKYVCSDTEVISITAVDADRDPNAGPFSFSLPEVESQGMWRIEPLNATSASLRALKPLWSGHYRVAFRIQDKQGLACPFPLYLDLHVCYCDKGETCKRAK